MSSTTYQSPYKATPTSTHFDTFIRWLRLKKYRIEVTYGVYVFTPGEKLVFWTFFALFFGILWTALVLYVHRSLAFLLDVFAPSFTPLFTPSEAKNAISFIAGVGAQNSQIA